jgi:SET domain-containing protein
MKTIIASVVKVNYHEQLGEFKLLPYCIGETSIAGRGLYATQNIAKGQCIIHAPCIAFSTEDTKVLMNTKLAHYLFDAEIDERTVFPLGHAMLFNHDQQRANVVWTLDGLDYADFRAIRDIRKGEELLVDYGYDPINNTKLSEL